MYIYIHINICIHILFIAVLLCCCFLSFNIAYCLCTPQNDYENKLAILENDRLDKTVNSLSPSEKGDVYKNGMYEQALCIVL